MSEKLTFHAAEDEALRMQKRLEHGKAPTYEEASEQESRPFEQRLTEQLNSPEFLETLREFPEDHRERILGHVIEYYIVHPDGFDFHEYLQGLKENVELLDKPNADLYFNPARTKLIIDSIVKKLVLPGMDDSDSQNRIEEYIKENFLQNGYIFHSFNGVFEESIRKHGLHPNERLWDWNDLKQIQDIGTKVGVPMILGWSDLNSRGNVFFGDALEIIYRYAVASPEWFGQFVASGYHMSPSPPYDKEAFYRRDHDAAKRNVLLLCDSLMSRKEEDIAAGKSRPNLTSDERAKIIDFFEENWRKFCGEKSAPKVALAPRKLFGLEKKYHMSTFDEFKAKAESFSDSSFVGYAEWLLSYGVNRDAGTTKTLPPEELTIISLPPYDAVHDS